MESNVKAFDSDTLMEFPLLNGDGFMEIKQVFGDDLMVVNAARVSYGSQHKQWNKNNDPKLINYLWMNEHTSPFRHPHFHVRMKAPLAIMMQIYKHVVGIEATSSMGTKDHAWNQISQRYTSILDFYKPTVWRSQSKSSKQASGDPIEQQEEATKIYNEAIDAIENAMLKLHNLRVAREQIRFLNPQSTYTMVIWTVSLQALINFVDLREDKHAQGEIQEYARAFKAAIEIYFPETYKVWQKKREKVREFEEWIQEKKEKVIRH